MITRSSTSADYIRRARIDAALEAMADTASDAFIALLIAGHLLATRPPYHLSIHHDTRPLSARERKHKLRDEPTLCPLPFDWKYKNTVGITARDPKRAATWIMHALLLGYAVSRRRRPRGWAFNKGTIEQWRRFHAERAADGK